MLRTLFMVLGGLSLAGFFLGPLLAQTGVVPGAVGFGIMALGCLLGVVTVLVEVVLLVARRGPKLTILVALLGLFPVPAGFAVNGHAARRGTRFSLAAACLGLVPAIFAVYGLAAGSRYPLINDISTDFENPPQIADFAALPENQGRDLTFPAGNGAIIRQRYPNIVPLTRADDTQTVYDQALSAARELGWAIVAEHSGDTAKTFEASEVSSIFRFQDDIWVRVRPGEAGSIVDVRSKSREGKGDFGANAKRIAQFMEKLEP